MRIIGLTSDNISTDTAHLTNDPFCGMICYTNHTSWRDTYETA